MIKLFIIGKMKDVQMFYMEVRYGKTEILRLHESIYKREERVWADRIIAVNKRCEI